MVATTATCRRLHTRGRQHGHMQGAAHTRSPAWPHAGAAHTRSPAWPHAGGCTHEVTSMAACRRLHKHGAQDDRTHAAHACACKQPHSRGHANGTARAWPCEWHCTRMAMHIAPSQHGTTHAWPRIWHHTRMAAHWRVT
eukprot:353517-Chlamydomonas_euryale.AAC.14